MKKILSFLLSVTLVFTLLGSGVPAFATADASNQNNPQSDAAKEDAEKKAEGGTTDEADKPTENTETNENASSASYSAPPEVKSDSYIVIDAKTSQVLISKNRDKKQYPADLSMIMTAALSLETIGANNLPTASRTLTAQDLFRNGKAPNNFAPRWIAYDVGETVSGETLMTCTLLGPYDDCATALANLAAESTGKVPAQTTPSSEEDSSDLPVSSTDSFVQMMNQKAKSIGLQNTHFATPRGAYSEEQYTTAFDMAQIVRYAINVEGFQKYFSRNTYNIPPSSKHNETRTASRPSYAMMNPDSSIYCKDTFGIKTGYNDQSNSTGVAATTRNGRTLIAVVLNCPGKDASLPQTDMAQLLEYCFANFQAIEFTDEDFKPVTLNVYDKRDVDHSIVGKSVVSLGGKLNLLIHKKYNRSDISVVADIPGHFFKDESQTATITFTLNTPEENGIQYMDSNMGKLGLNVETELDEELKAKKKAAQAALFNEIKKWATIVGVIILVIVVLLLAIRFYNIQRYKKLAAKKRAAKRRREKLKKQ